MRDRAKDNVPTERQRAGFVSYVELQKVRKKLTFGSKCESGIYVAHCNSEFTYLGYRNSEFQWGFT